MICSRYDPSTERARMSETYDAGFFRDLVLARSAAEVIVPLIIAMVSPRSVVDIGCGIGVWLAACRRAGIDDVIGTDGDYVPRSQLLIPGNRFVAADLTAPFDLGRRFDLAISLEVAEHLTEAAAEGFVASLVQIAPVILFSAAIPGQGGPGHVNEQWQEYWRSKFAAVGYVACDAIRPLVWGDNRVDYYYQQNILVYVATGELGRHPRLTSAIAGRSVDLVHPWLFKNHMFWEPNLGWLAKILLPTIAKSARHHWANFSKRWSHRSEGP